jgi:uncharacterized protein (DUF305 family)
MTQESSKKVRSFAALLIVAFTVLAFALALGKNDSSTAQLTSAEEDFLTMMIPHHQQAIEMAELAATRSNDQELLALAMQIKDAQGPEIETMRSLMQKYGLEASAESEDSGSHMAHMHGMLNDEEMAALEAATGDEFDRLFLEGMIKHHEGAIDMVALVGNSELLQEFGATIFTVQNEEIAKMRSMLLAKG